MGHLGHILAHRPVLQIETARHSKVWDTYNPPRVAALRRLKAQHLGLRRQVSFSIVLDLLKLSKPMVELHSS